MGLIESITVEMMMRNMLGNMDKLMTKLAEAPESEDAENAKMLEYLIVPMMALEGMLNRAPQLAALYMPQSMVVFAKLKDHPLEPMLKKIRAGGNKAAAEAQATVDALFGGGKT